MLGIVNSRTEFLGRLGIAGYAGISLFLGDLDKTFYLHFSIQVSGVDLGFTVSMEVIHLNGVSFLFVQHN